MNMEFTYDEAKNRLEEILTSIDSGRLKIDELEATLTEARNLIALCKEKLEKAEKIVLEWEQ